MAVKKQFLLTEEGVAELKAEHDALVAERAPVAEN